MLQKTDDAVLELREGMRWVQLERRIIHADTGMDGDQDKGSCKRQTGRSE